MPAKVAYVTSQLPFGPGEAFAIPEIRALGRLGVEIVVVPVRTAGGLVHPDAGELVQRTRRVGLLSRTVLRGAARAVVHHPLASVGVLVRLIAGGGRPRVLAKNLAVLPKGLWLADILEAEGFSHVHAYWASTPGTVALIAAAVSGVTMSMTAHSWDIGESNCLAAKTRRAVVTRVISRDGQQDLLARIPRDAGASVRLIHLGVDVPDHPPTITADARLRILVPAAFVPFKGHGVLIDAARLLQAGGLAVRVLLVGAGPLRAALEEAVRLGGLVDMVSFAGQLGHEELLSRYDRGTVDLVVLASVTQPDGSREGIPISLVEAMARAIPVVGTSCGGVPELLAGEAGMVVPEARADELADAIAQLCADPARRQRLGATGRRRVQADFDVVTQARRFCAAAQISTTGDVQ